MRRWNLIWASQGRNAGNRLLPVLVLPASICRLLCTIFATECTGVYCVGVTVFVCLLAGARAHTLKCRSTFWLTLFTRDAHSTEFCDSSFCASRLALIEFGVARLIMHSGQGRSKKGWKQQECCCYEAFFLWFIICLIEMLQKVLPTYERTR